MESRSAGVVGGNDQRSGVNPGEGAVVGGGGDSGVSGTALMEAIELTTSGTCTCTSS